MSNENIKSQINDFLIEEFEIDPVIVRLFFLLSLFLGGGEIDPELINPEAKLKDDLGLDSLDFVDVVVEIEDVFGIKLTGDDFINIVTLDDFHNLIIKKLK